MGTTAQYQLLILLYTHLLLDYANNFKIKYDGSKWYIEITNGLDDAIIQKNTELVMALIAKESGNDYEVESALILKLPVTDDTTAPRFSAAYYLAEYPQGGSGVIEFKNSLEILNVADQNSVTINLDSK